MSFNVDSLTDEKVFTCALNRIFNFEPRTGRFLIESYGSAKAVFQADKEDLGKELRIGEKYIRQITDKEAEASFKELRHLEKSGVSFVGINESSYPALLKECFDAPIGLYLKSSSSPDNIFCGKTYIAIVGSRNMSSYGQEWCSRICEVLSGAETKPFIVSGLAIGVDGQAHRSAIKKGLSTIAVMATGIDEIYPYRHKDLGEIIARSPGSGLVTDFPPLSPPLPVNFIRRNRIIAGLCQSVVLIESRIKGGGMSTARLAFSYNRDVYALPGRLDDSLSSGCNKLIEEKAAELLFSPESFAEKAGLQIVLNKGRPLAEDVILEGGRFPELGIEERRALAKLSGIIRRSRDISIEDLRIITGWEYSEVSSMTALLESEGIIKTDILQRCSLSPAVS